MLFAHGTPLQPAELLVATGWTPSRLQFRGIVEGFFARLNRQLLRALPGPTFSNVVERGDYDPAQHACLSLGALEEILVLFCVDYYPQRFNRGHPRQIDCLDESPRSVFSEPVRMDVSNIGSPAE